MPRSESSLSDNAPTVDGLLNGESGLSGPSSSSASSCSSCARPPQTRRHLTWAEEQPWPLERVEKPVVLAES